MPIARESEKVESTLEKYPTVTEATTAHSSGQRSRPRYGSTIRKIASASRNHNVQCGSVGLKTSTPSTSHCTSDQIDCMIT
ncbi:hypothetical protein GCM10025869_26470 [Homoserinibacter gongjuensis]|uniref:Uncharacterized protein n=1 Tax=Homoserinibacter gongjuensis TaxID=1162968 RepID=A0ABQ6JXJ3_9MICO|nr:hypothetical protein GCM10025869_26470 [Homoserinibacter gongjuensis]